MSVVFRHLQRGDYGKGFLNVLSQLTTVGNVSRDVFDKRYDMISKNPNHRVFVGEKDNKIVCTATLLIENKFIHECKNTGHIEDVAVDNSLRGTGVGRQLIETLITDAKKNDCYKVILDCSDNNIKFYEKCGMKKKGNEMAYYFD